MIVLDEKMKDLAAEIDACLIPIKFKYSKDKIYAATRVTRFGFYCCLFLFIWTFVYAAATLTNNQNLICGVTISLIIEIVIIVFRNKVAKMVYNLTKKNNQDRKLS